MDNHRSLFAALCAVALLAATAAGQSWVSRYDAGDEDYAAGLATDAAGNVYVTGSSWGSGTSYDIATAKYNTAGGEVWARRFDGAASGSDEAHAIAVRGNRVAVTGGSADTNGYSDVVTLLYDDNGVLLWSETYNGPGDGNDQGLAVTLDGDGNVYVAGYAYDSENNWDFVTIKYDPDGNQQWATAFSTEFEDFASHITVDDAGNVYVTGSSGNPYLLTWDFTTVKYDADGDEQWAVQYNGPAGEDDEPYGLAVDRLGNVYVTGGSLDSTSNMDYATIKYSPAGQVIWLRRYNGPDNGLDEARALALDDAGNVYVTGLSQGTGTDLDYATVKYDSDGNLLWQARYDGPASGFDEALALVVDNSGAVYVTGASAGDGTRADYATVKYRPDGSEEWVHRYDGPASRFDEAVAIALDPTGGVCVAGTSEGDGTGADYATLRYPRAGIAEAPSAARPARLAGPTLIRGVLNLSRDTRAGHDRNPPGDFGSCPKPTLLLDASGRSVMALDPGANDVTALSPGVYFVALGRTVSHKVLITR